MRNKFGILCMSVGTVLVFAALSLFLINREEAARAGEAADAVMSELMVQLGPDGNGANGENGQSQSDFLPDPYDAAMTEVEIDGYRYIGYISAESIGLQLPVMSDWSYSQLKIAPCRYSGSTKTDNLVIAAHNYIRHFGQLKQLAEGDIVYFTDMDGIVTEYAVAAVEILQPTAVEDMTAGDFDLTLFTCTYGGQSRVAVRCDRTGGRGRYE